MQYVSIFKYIIALLLLFSILIHSMIIYENGKIRIYMITYSVILFVLYSSVAVYDYRQNTKKTTEYEKIK